MGKRNTDVTIQFDYPYNEIAKLRKKYNIDKEISDFDITFAIIQFCLANSIDKLTEKKLKNFL